MSCDSSKYIIQNTEGCKTLYGQSYKQNWIIDNDYCFVNGEFYGFVVCNSLKEGIVVKVANGNEFMNGQEVTLKHK
jgi:hypothetical protein